VLLGFLAWTGGSPAAAPETVRIEMTEFAFHPAVIRVRAGSSVSLKFVNRGQLAHQFVADVFAKLPVIVTDTSVRVEAPGLAVLRLQPAAAAAVQFTPRRTGQFRFACTIEGHREAGMAGLLIVY